MKSSKKDMKIKISDIYMAEYAYNVTDDDAQSTN